METVMGWVFVAGIILLVALFGFVLGTAWDTFGDWKRYREKR